MGGWDGQSCLRTEEEGLARQRPQEEGPMEAWGVRLRSPIRSWSSAALRDAARCTFFVGSFSPPPPKIHMLPCKLSCCHSSLKKKRRTMNSDEEYGSIFRALSGTSGIGPTGAGRGASKWGGGRYLALQRQIAWPYCRATAP